MSDDTVDVPKRRRRSNNATPATGRPSPKQAKASRKDGRRLQSDFQAGRRVPLSQKRRIRYVRQPGLVVDADTGAVKAVVETGPGVKYTSVAAMLRALCNLEDVLERRGFSNPVFRVFSTPSGNRMNLQVKTPDGTIEIPDPKFNEYRGQLAGDTPEQWEATACMLIQRALSGDGRNPEHDDKYFLPALRRWHDLVIRAKKQ